MILEPFESKIGQEFRKSLKGNNFMTPIIKGYIQTNKGIAEISTGNNFLDIEMYGVTVVDNGRKFEYDRCFHCYSDVEKYIEELNYENEQPLINLLNEIVSFK